MKIVIAGGGKVGETLCRELSLENNDVVLIEKKQWRLERVISKTDITGLAGNAASYETQVEADVGACDIFIAVTPEDEINIIAAIIAKKLGATYTIARVRNPEYANHMGFMREGLGITMMINPELEAAKDIAKVIRYPEALSVEQFANGRVNIVEINVSENSQLAHTYLSEFRHKFDNVNFCAISRDDFVFIPSGDTKIEENDHIFVTGGKKDLTKLYRKCGLEQRKLRSALIVGGGRVAHYLIDMLSEMRMEIKVIESNHRAAKELSYQYPRVVVIEGDGTDQEFLKEERIELYDTAISLTGVDEENILISLYALNQGAKKVITKVSRTDLLKLLDNAGLQSIITPKRLIANEIIRFVRSLNSDDGSNVEALFRIADNQVEAIQFRVPENSRVTHQCIQDLNMKNNLLIAYIVRNNELIFPSGKDRIESGDQVIITTTIKSLENVEDILV
ncbi:Trk system potassium transporter TrkA [Alkalibacterium kapii]|uniref:Trk system potassium uptake protein TrkA n=1 Tax=Alkalibacterium kapii TaxID=426704 RepID=A0A511ARL8_9LACT|nr:Trk system potassium transporter TrkA [Alkalibacterium kapii]GEK90850.1 Trk system potassium transport protein TrkA [Alkalibacterium kapii]